MASARTTQSVEVEDSITILVPVPPYTATKHIKRGADGKVEIASYNAGTYFGVLTHPVGCIESLSQVLKAAERTNCLAIRGEPGPHIERMGKAVRRKKGDNFTTPDVGRHPVMIDFDKTPLPPGMSLAKGVMEVCEYLVSILPPEFHDASYHWQLSSSAGFTDPSVVSMHLWFWLDRPVPDANLKAWAKDWNAKAGRKIIDPALFNDVQAHYVAAPTFSEGVVDPFPERSGLVRKANDSVAIVLPVPEAQPQARPVATPGGRARKRTSAPVENRSGGFEAILGEIGDHPGGDGFHNPIIRAVASYVATHDPSEIDVEELYEIVRARVLAADRSFHPDGYVKRMASREHIIPAIMGAFAKYATRDNPRRKSRRIEDIPPHFPNKTTTVNKATAQLQGAIDKLIG